MYVTKSKYSEYAKDTVPRVSTARTPRRKHPSRRATMSLLPKKATTNPLPRLVTGLGTTIIPLPQGQLATYVMQDDDKPLTTRASDHVHCARQ
jgi:hypothetical protein